MPEQTSQSIGTIRCERELREDLFLGCIEFPERQQRQCVIHFLPAGDDLGRRRFVREAMLGFDVTRAHRNLLSTLFFGVWEDGRLFMAVECVEGRAVSELTAELRGRFAAIRAIAHSVLQALEYLHEQGVVHGRVVGSNILIGVDGVVRLGNFSRAKRVAPGQVDASAFRADLRALGELLFELVADIQRSHLQLFVDAETRACLPAETTPELVALIEQLLDESDQLSAPVALASLADGVAPLGVSEPVRKELSLLAGDLDSAQSLLPPASEIDVEIAEEFESSGAESEEELALLFATMLHRLGGDVESDSVADEPAATSSMPGAPGTTLLAPGSVDVDIPPPPRKRISASFLVATLALLLAVYGIFDQGKSAPTEGSRVMAQVEDTRTGQRARPVQGTDESGLAELRSRLVASEPVSVPEPAAKGSTGDNALLADSSAEGASDGPREDSAEYGASAAARPEQAPAAEANRDALRPEGLARRLARRSKESRSQRAERSWPAEKKNDAARYEFRLKSGSSDQLVFISSTEARSHGLHFVLDRGVFESGGLKLFGHLSNLGSRHFKVAELGLSGHLGSQRGTFSFKPRGGECTTDGSISIGAKCHFFFEISQLKLKADQALVLVVSGHLGLRRAALTLHEDA